MKDSNYCLICRTPTDGPRLCGGHRHLTPAQQLRIQLDKDRDRGRDFEEAWEEILSEGPTGRIAWPHDTTHRREWKAILGSRKQKKVWREAYCGTGSMRSSRSLANLDLIAA